MTAYSGGSWPRARRAVLGLALACAAAFAWPGLSLPPFRTALEHSRTPEATVGAIWLAFGAAAIVFAIMTIVWPWLARRSRAVFSWLQAVPDLPYWLIVGTLALALRAAVAAAIPYDPTADAAWYHEAALSLASGDGFAVGGALTAYRLPGYPFLLSLTYRVFGPHVALAWSWGLLASAVVIGMTFTIARRLYGSEAARLAALAVAIYPALALLTGQAMSDLVFLAGVLWLMSVVLSRASSAWWSALAVGVAIGLLTLTREVGLGLIVMVPVAWRLRGNEWPRLARQTLLLVCGFALVVTPWVERNRTVFDRAMLSTNVGFNAFLGHHHGASGAWDFAVEPRPASPGMNEAEVDWDLLRQALAFVRAHPLEDLALVPKKLANLYALETSAVTALFQGPRASADLELKYVLYGVTQLAYVLLLAAFAFRACDVAAGRHRPRDIQWIGWVFVLYVSAVCVVFFGQDRFRLLILPWMIVEVCGPGATRLQRAPHTPAR